MIGRERQTLADVALEACGNCEALFPIMRRHGLSANTPAEGVDFGGDAVMDRKVVQHYAMNSHSPACMAPDEDPYIEDEFGYPLEWEEENIYLT